MFNLFRFSYKYVAVIFVAAIFVFSLIAGFKSGKAKSRTEFVLKTQEEIKIGLDNFYSDQDRYPTLDEFYNTAIMLNYFYSELSQDPKSKTCSETFVYKKLTNSSYQLDFCLDNQINNFNKGWNQILVNK